MNDTRPFSLSEVKYVRYYSMERERLEQVGWVVVAVEQIFGSMVAVMQRQLP
jgi:hypothetical protein